MSRGRAIEPRSVQVGMGVVSGLVLLFLYVPLFVIMLYAFNPARAQSWPLPGLSTRWFVATWNNVEVRTALPGLSYRTRLVGPLSSGGECNLFAGPTLDFFTAYVLAPSELLEVRYRGAGRAMARVTNPAIRSMGAP